MPLFDIKDDVFLVTGATKGIGKVISQRIVSSGGRVIVSSRKEGDCRDLCDQLNSDWAGAAPVAVAAPGDIRSLQSLSEMAEQALQAWGRIDTLVCNAAILPFHGPSENTPDTVFLDLLQSNVFNYFKLCHMLIPQMKKRRDGNIIFISSGAGLMATPEVLAYGVSKAAEMHMARCLAAELAPFNIRVNSVSPGLTRSEASRPIWEDPVKLRDNVGTIPLQRIGEGDDIAASVLFLASRGGSYITGQTIAVDGGRSSLGAESDARRILVDSFKEQGGYAGDRVG